MSHHARTLADDVMRSAPEHGPWDEYVADPKRVAAGVAQVTRDAYDDGVDKARRGWPRRLVPYLPETFQRAWLSGYDAARAQGERHASQARTTPGREQHAPALPAKRHSA